jgi:hypothetical protein
MVFCLFVTENSKDIKRQPIQKNEVVFKWKALLTMKVTRLLCGLLVALVLETAGEVRSVRLLGKGAMWVRWSSARSLNPVCDDGIINRRSSVEIPPNEQLFDFRDVWGIGFNAFQTT